MQRDRFGWRVWKVSDGSLLSPFWPDGTTYVLPAGAAAIAEAHCEHGNDIPSQSCPCGMHYLPMAAKFLASPLSIVAIYGTVVTFGVTYGAIASDRLSKWTYSRRARYYQPLAILPCAGTPTHQIETTYPGCTMFRDCTPATMRDVETNLSNALVGVTGEPAPAGSADLVPVTVSPQVGGIF